MADDINYDYPSMEAAFEEMKRYSQNISSTTEDMTSDTRALLEQVSGAYALAYGDRSTTLKGLLDTLQQDFANRAVQLQQMFDDMKAFDQGLAGRI